MCRVLILDDDLFFAETIQLILQNEGETHPDIATQAEDAIQKVALASGKNKPYEILLIDHRLGPGKDGIEVFKELRAISPDSDGIILTGYEDPESGPLAYEAGAFRYLPKTATNREILFVFRSLRQWRKERREHNWQKIFSKVLEASIRAKDFQAVALAVARASLKLGFARAHLFWRPSGHDANPDGRLLGIQSAGQGCIPGFKDRLFPVAEWLEIGLLEKAHTTFSFQCSGHETVCASMRARGYQPPPGDITFLPLRSGDTLAGLLMLDHGQTSKSVSEHERGWLDFYAKQVSLVLEHAALDAKEQKSTQEQEEASQIGQEITAGATDKAPAEILEAVRGKLGAYFDTNNFMAILLDEQSQELEIQLHYRNGQMYDPIRQPPGSGLAGWFLARGKTLRISSDVAGFAQENGIQLTGEIPASWLGVPLRVNGKVIGGFILQKFQSDYPFIERDEHRLTLIADQVAGALQNCRAAEKERLEMEKLSVLSRAGFELLQVARENEPNLWKTVLTLATASFGVGFNRAMLFLVEEQDKLVGRAAIGTEDREQAWRDWETDKERHYTFDDFLGDLRARNLKLTDFDPLIQKIEIPLKDRADVFTEVLDTGQIKRLDEEEARYQLPPEVSAKISLATCAALPLIAGKGKVAGIVLVDNKHNGKPIFERDLNRLQTVLNYAGLIWETLREREKSESLLEASQEIMSRSGRENLVDTLARVCNAALGMSEADWDIIYPFLTDQSDEIVFDHRGIAFAGELMATPQNVIDKKKPSRSGITAYILKHGSLYVPDISLPEAKIGHKRLKDDAFIKREAVKSLIGMRVEDPFTQEALGVFYLNFRQVRQFSRQDQLYAQSFASLAAFAISNARRMDEQEQRRRLDAALDTAEAVNSGTGQEEMLKNALDKLHEFFQETTLCVLTYDENEHALKFAPGALEFYKITNPAYRRMRSFPLANTKAIACAVARNTLKSGKIEILNIENVREHPEYLGLIVETQSELCASLVGSDHKLLGVLALERRTKAGFNPDDEALVQTVARQLSLGLERFKQQQEINFNKTIAALNAWAADMAHEINTEAGNIQKWAYLIQEFAEDSPTIQTYGRFIEEGASNLLSAGAWNNQARMPILLDQMLQKLAEKIAGLHDLAIQMEAGAAGVYIHANPAQFERVLRHLIRNAARAMSTSKKKMVAIRTRRLNEKLVEIQMQDFGSGVPEKVRPFILQQPVTTKNRGGNGLLITRHVIEEEMGGTIRLLPTEAGKGAVFSIKLPVFNPDETGDQ